MSSPDYNPYLHGTTSTALAALAATDHQLMPILTLLDKYQIAPMTGEIRAGGFNTLPDNLIVNAGTGTPSFGQLRPILDPLFDVPRNYDLKKIKSNYTHFKMITPEEAIQQFEKEWKSCYEQNYQNFCLLLIYYARARKLNPHNDLFSNEELKYFEKNFELTLQYYQVAELFLSGYIVTTKNSTMQKIPALEEKTFKLKLSQNKLDISEILENPTKKAISSLMNTLGVSTEFFNIIEKPSKVNYKEEIYNFFKNQRDIQEMVALINLTFVETDASIPRKQFQRHYAILKECFDIFKKIYHADYTRPRETYNFSSEFPIIFVTESLHLQPYGDEFRTKYPLKLGVNIHLIATDSVEHQQEVQAYIDHYQLTNIQVVLFDELENPNFLPAIREIQQNIRELEHRQAEQARQALKNKVNESQPITTTIPTARPTNTFNPTFFSPPLNEEEGGQKYGLTQNQETAIDKHSEKLSEEINAFFSWNVERKKIKLEKLKELKELAKRMPLNQAIAKIKENPNVCKGFISTRTADLLQNLIKTSP